jgi:hypothetical protein
MQLSPLVSTTTSGFVDAPVFASDCPVRCGCFSKQMAKEHILIRS